MGGVVRDAALGAPGGPDLDLVVEGSAAPVADEIGRVLGRRVTHHPRFLTATVELPGAEHVDIVTARTERYRAPGALPEVAPGVLADDLARRDFSINAMAIRFADGREELVDPHGGLADLAANRLVALREGLFAEDPSRVVRAARYAGRMDLHLDDATGREVLAAAPRLNPRSTRVAAELRRLVESPGVASGVGLLREWGVPWIVADVGAAASWVDAVADALARAGAPDLAEWPLRLAGMADPSVIAEMALPGWSRGIAVEAAGGGSLAATLAGLDRASEVDEVLHRSSGPAAVAALALGAERVARWWRDERDVALAVDGGDLVERGVAPGPAIGRALTRVRAELLDRGAMDAGEQLALALAVARDEA